MSTCSLVIEQWLVAGGWKCIFTPFLLCVKKLQNTAK